MKFRVIRSRKQIQITEFEAPTSAGALRAAEIYVDQFRSIMDEGDEWSYEVSPVR